MSSRAEANGAQGERQEQPPPPRPLRGEASQLFLVLALEEPRADSVVCSREPQIAKALGLSGRKSRWALLRLGVAPSRPASRGGRSPHQPRASGFAALVENVPPAGHFLVLRPQPLELTAGPRGGRGGRGPLPPLRVSVRPSPQEFCCFLTNSALSLGKQN
ncbi:unnamed protein product [Gulo gulo]|uniref:Uncharacterized protein n=1 Tax=Gulo gulo TaxID=48420 RepID=A0A9X9PXK6_GULGU|nr:unnamed protein product [Gulo gulo]